MTCLLASDSAVLDFMGCALSSGMFSYPSPEAAGVMKHLSHFAESANR